MPSSRTRRLPSIRPWVTGYPHLVTTCGSSPAACWARTISWVLIVYPALVVGSASVTRCRIVLARGGDTVLARGGGPPGPPPPPGGGGVPPPPPRLGGGGRP